VVGQDGGTAVLKHGPTYEVLATNKLDDKFDASPALVGSEVYLRGYRYLYCVAAN
jgi:outer membrane protein assembly factor BamB